VTYKRSVPLWRLLRLTSTKGPGVFLARSLTTGYHGDILKKDRYCPIRSNKPFASREKGVARRFIEEEREKLSKVLISKVSVFFVAKGFDITKVSDLV
jgi:hypothetical protein